MDSKKIIAKLIKIANNQQKIIAKLAQAVDPNIDYLRGVAQQVAANTGFKATNFFVTTTGGGASSIPPDNKVTTSPVGYIVSMKGSPEDNNLRQRFVDTFKKQVATQKPDQPDLVNNLSILFE